RAVWTSLDAVLATDAIGMVDHDHAVLGLVRGAGWAHLHASRMGAVVTQLGHEECFLHLRVLVAIGETIFPFRAGGRDVHRIGLAVDVRRVLAFQIDVTLDPGAEVMGVAGNLVFRLARLDAAQAADAFCGIDAESPTVLGPVIARDVRYWRRRTRSGSFAHDGIGRDRQAATAKGSRKGL